MSKSTTTSATATTKMPQTAATHQQSCATMPGGMLQDKIAMLAYQKWLKGGCRDGEDKKNWLEAEAELKAEMTKNGTRGK